ncbi:isochorismatase family protein family [Aspergillus clavatus NRRL 1]|uniref:Isochorismatase family protein family n=1 Tax=Aspergillus clavatus (strain ATCC 1007 / CBS 513.65 / DSM 816 / NCTC 3887 / NRRL 1 / QM 1276 / 107) TaxID=344612 RepID=A1CLF0_ASPCL|nr:isochorismatase family protein family [Aspergillus clavatus NRRL 1]EAW09974.1 isochorismatase family protein family [Aspergillus clavatus NRRL 1]
MSLISSFGALPTIQTRKALLLLDFQNDFIRPSGALHVANTADIVEILPQLVNAFRHTGDVLWVRSYYESPRPLIDSDLQERIVLGPAGEERRKKQPKLGGPSDRGSQKESQTPVDEEAFLSNESSQCCRPRTSGVQFPAPILAALDADSDTLMEKSDYSALQDDGMILSLRTRFITELYLCGSLSNVSVYATALDAVRHGFSVTLIEDCLGFRDFARHEEAMRRMADIFGASGITSQELLEELDWQETDAIARQTTPKPSHPATAVGIEGVLDELNVKTGRGCTANEGAADSSRSRRRRLELVDLGDGEEETLLSLSNLARSRSRFGTAGSPGSAAQSQGPSGEKKARVRVRRAKRQDQKAESSTRADGSRSSKAKRSRDIRGPGDMIGEGDSRIIHDLDLPPDAFEKIRSEVAWQKMYHMSGQVPRLVAVQGQTSDNGSIPIYRHPADESPPLHPFTPAVNQVRVIVERILGHPLNHVLIQLYRDGQDSISEHSDKTLDIVRGSSICNVSLGAQRVMTLRNKVKGPDEDQRPTQRIPMPHESLFILGETTNMRWLHGIRPDKRQEAEKSREELAYGGERISLTFRHIGTFLSPTGDTIWGQGAVSKDHQRARPVIHGDPTATDRLIRAFGQENHAVEFDWDAVYGGGFDVVNFVTTTTTTLIEGSDSVANLRVRLALSENGIRYDVSKSPKETAVGKVTEDDQRPLFIATDGSEVAGDAEIMKFLAQHASGLTRAGVEVLRGGDRLPEIDTLLQSWRQGASSDGHVELDTLDTWEKAVDGQHYLGGPALGLDDCFLWPVLRDMVLKSGPLPSDRYPNLAQYYRRMEKRGIVKATVEELE